MIELVWVNDAEEAQSECSRRTQLWERWSGREGKASPFGICVRPVDSQNTESPFPAGKYQPSYLPDPLVMHIGEAGVEEPMWVYLGFMRRFDREQRFVEHPLGIREITNLTLTTPVPLCSTASQSMVESGILSSQVGPKSLLEIEFDSNRRKEIVDFRPHLRASFNFDSRRESRSSGWSRSLGECRPYAELEGILVIYRSADHVPSTVTFHIYSVRKNAISCSRSSAVIGSVKTRA